MPTRLIRGLLAFLISVLLLTLISPLSAKADVSVQPHIGYSDNSGLSFSADAKSLGGLQNPKFQWFVNGKAVSGATKAAYKASSKQKNQSIQLKVNAGGVTVSSVVAKIGQVIVNVKPVASLATTANNKVQASAGSFSPKTAKPSYQWYKGPIEITDAKSSTYIASAIDQGFKVYVSVKYSAKGFVDSKAESNAIEVPVTKRSYVQIWQDEFNLAAGSAPDSSIWVSENGDGSKAVAGGGWGNKERQYYIPNLAKITSSGALQIDAKTSGAGEYTCYYKGPCEWVSSKYITKGKVGFKYGRVEARIKGPVGAGTWGAFWMLGADIDDRGWPGCGEIDVTELLGSLPSTNLGYIHGPSGSRGERVDMKTPHASEYHTYAVDWLPDQIRYYLDGVPFLTLDKRDAGWVYDHEFYIIINLAMGGNLGGEIEANLKDSTMEFDYIRVYSINGVGEVIKHKA